MCMNLENRDNLVEGHAYEKKKNKINLKRKKGVIQIETILSLPLVFLGASGFTHPFEILPALLIGIFYILGRLRHFLLQLGSRYKYFFLQWKRRNHKQREGIPWQFSG